MTSDLSPPALGGERLHRSPGVSQLSQRRKGRQDGALVDLRVTEVSAGELGLVSKLLLDPAGQRPQRSNVRLKNTVFTAKLN